jgi:hypothetical protein
MSVGVLEAAVLKCRRSDITVCLYLRTEEFSSHIEQPHTPFPRRLQGLSSLTAHTVGGVLGVDDPDVRRLRSDITNLRQSCFVLAHADFFAGCAGKVAGYATNF